MACPFHRSSIHVTEAYTHCMLVLYCVSHHNVLTLVNASVKHAGLTSFPRLSDYRLRSHLYFPLFSTILDTECRSTTSPTSTYFHSIHLLSNLVSLTISPDARISPDEFNKRTAQYDPNQFCLTTLLPKLNTLRHLYIHGQDLRYRNYGRDAASQLGGVSLFECSVALHLMSNSDTLPAVP